MKKKQRVPILLLIETCLLPVLFFTGCKEEYDAPASKAYYVISEELDIGKTVDKAQEILENAESRTPDISGNAVAEEKNE